MQQKAFGLTGTLSRLLRLMFAARLGVRKAIVCGSAAEVVNILQAVATPYLLKLMVDGVLAPEPWRDLLVITVLLFALSSGAVSAGTSIKHRASTRISEALAADILLQTLHGRLPALATASNDEGGRLFGQLERLLFNIQKLIDGLFWQVAPMVLQVAISLLVLLAIMPIHHALVIGLLLILYLAASVSGTSRHREYVAFASEKGADLSAAVSDLLHSAPRIVFNGNIALELDRILRLSHTRANAADLSACSLIRMSLVQCCLLVVGLAVLLGLAVQDVLDGRLSVGDVVLLQTYALRLVLPLGAFAFMLRQSERAILELSKMPMRRYWRPEISEPALPLPTGAASLCVEKLSFAFGEDRAVIRDLDMSVPAGSLVAIVGANGSGKSTLARVIAGVLAPDKGVVRIGGLDVATIAPEQRHQLALYVPQHVTMFARTLKENGLYPPCCLNGERLATLLELNRFHPDGHAPDLEQQLGEGGAGISGGQAQKLELARLCGAEIPLIILDETTSALDPVSEAEAIASLRRERRGSTIILVTHRRVTAAGADQVYFISDGSVLFSGPDVKRRSKGTPDRRRRGTPFSDNMMLVC